MSKVMKTMDGNEAAAYALSLIHICLTFLEKDLQAEREYDTIPLLFENENGFL